MDRRWCVEESINVQYKIVEAGREEQCAAAGCSVQKVTEVCCGGAAVIRKTSDAASGFGKQDEAWPAGTLFCGVCLF